MASTSSRPSVTLEVQDFRCDVLCSEAHRPGAERPFVVKVSLSDEAKTELLRRTGTVHEDCFACVNMRCGGLFQALGTLAPLQELVK